MVWFQCEDCGENLKKPKLLIHFRCCSARKLSCIDCGVVFNRESVQFHTSCVTEAEKYGPKGVVDKSGQKPKSSPTLASGDLDLSYGLSTRPPWACSVCNVKATSQEALAVHSQGKKHRVKVRTAVSKETGNGLWKPSGEDDKVAGPSPLPKPAEEVIVVATPTSRKKRKSYEDENDATMADKKSKKLDGAPRIAAVDEAVQLSREEKLAGRTMNGEGKAKKISEEEDNSFLGTEEVSGSGDAVGAKKSRKSKKGKADKNGLEKKHGESCQTVSKSSVSGIESESQSEKRKKKISKTRMTDASMDGEIIDEDAGAEVGPEVEEQRKATKIKQKKKGKGGLPTDDTVGKVKEVANDVQRADDKRTNPDKNHEDETQDEER